MSARPETIDVTTAWREVFGDTPQLPLSALDLQVLADALEERADLRCMPVRREAVGEREFAASLAHTLQDLLSPWCERLRVAGSLRRHAASVNDIELIVIPRRQTRQVSLFDSAPVSLLEGFLADVKCGRVPHLRPGPGRKPGRAAAWGPKYKRLEFHGFPVDLYTVTPETWGALLAVRTGPADFSKQLVTARAFGGAMPDGHRLRSGRLFEGGNVLHTPTEQAFFGALGLPTWPPAERSCRRLNRYLCGRN